MDIIHPLDIFGRVGGDEFLILFKYPENIKNVEKYCQHMIEKTKVVEYRGNNIETSISIGVVVSDSKTTYDELYKIADEALYEVKKNGRNNYRIVNNEKC